MWSSVFFLQCLYYSTFLFFFCHYKILLLLIFLYSTSSHPPLPHHPRSHMYGSTTYSNAGISSPVEHASSCKGERRRKQTNLLINTAGPNTVTPQHQVDKDTAFNLKILDSSQMTQDRSINLTPYQA